MLLAMACAVPPGDAPPASDSDSNSRATVPAEAPAQPEGHRRMVALLREIAEAAQEDNPYLGRRFVQRARDDLASMPASDVPKRWFLNMFLGRNELRMGNEEIALEHYLEANRLLGESRDPVPPDKYVQTMFETAVAYMRIGQSRNCVARRTPESCIFPITDGGVHFDREGSSRAIDYFRRTLEATRMPDPEHLRARWLLNIAHMTLGGYPDDVLPEYLIPPESFDSDEPFPRFVDVAPQLGLSIVDLAGGAVSTETTSWTSSSRRWTRRARCISSSTRGTAPSPSERSKPVWKGCSAGST
jgi:hypothetical protein